jgi:hypothetical protein
VAVTQTADLANKAARTFAIQVEALARLRGGGKQQVEVRHVYVDARGSQNIIGDVARTGGGGGALENGGQPHAVLGLDHSLTPEMPRPHPAREAVPVHADDGTQSLPHARRRQPRGAKRTRQRGLPDRPLDQGSNS